MSVTASSESPASHARHSDPYEDADRVNVLQLLLVLSKHKMLVLGLTVAAALISAVVATLLPNKIGRAHV